ncbi:hypothetical protein H5410_006468 [Solanum commersonii]|uniref:Uncharacterized protein n=1 Tax=Solanum commersonii TaxID=4109 RepID=A0A9J6AAJ9_SOLCO|nr:hypothetical protein H5410_006468 [Solanum commersonii]
MPSFTVSKHKLVQNVAKLLSMIISANDDDVKDVWYSFQYLVWTHLVKFKNIRSMTGSTGPVLLKPVLEPVLVTGFSYRIGSYRNRFYRKFPNAPSGLLVTG